MRTPVQRRQWLQTAAALALPATPLAWAAEPFPVRPVKLIVPLPAGGAADVAARLLANAMEGPLGQPVTVDNKPGGAFMVAINTLKSAPADGYTLLSINSGLLAVQAVLGQYDMFKQMVPIAGTGETDMCVAAASKTTFRSTRDLIDFGRANPGKLTYVTPGPGTLEHLALANLCQHYGIDAVHVPVRGGPDMAKMLLQNEADFGILAVPLAQAFAGPGKLRALAVLNEKRNPVLPDVPTYVEEKLDVPRLTIWGGLAAWAGTPKEVLDVLEKAALAAASRADLRQKIAGAGMNPGAVPAAAFGKQWQDDYAWIVRSAAAVKPSLTK